MIIKVINKSKHKLPEYSTKASAGMDLRANLETDIARHEIAEWESVDVLLETDMGNGGFGNIEN